MEYNKIFWAKGLLVVVVIAAIFLTGLLILAKRASM